jgi:2-polyprenyl-6-hydroxyphenyl methylase/3-demethylubiquinone-9 3-methyltransferase
MATGLQRQSAPVSTSTIDPAEVARFAAIAADWWDPRGRFAPLHRMNPVRIGYVRDQVIRHFSRDGESATPFENLSLLDVGCGGGLLTEPMTRLGARTTGVDAAFENIKVASLHAQQGGLTIDYRCNSAEELVAEKAQFDVVLALEIIEHVANPDLFYRALAELVKPGGILILSTLNRTAKSYAVAIVGAEMIMRWLPRGTHSWEKFIKPSEMASSLGKTGVTVVDTTGLAFSPLSWSFSLNPRDLDVNYLMTALKPA